MALRKDYSQLKDIIREDNRYKRLKESFDENKLFHMPIEQYLKEVESAHQIRPVRVLNPSDSHFVDKLISANTSDQSTRSRLTAIMMECVRASSTLQAATDSFREYVLMVYAEDLKSLRTKDERMMLINATLSPFLRYVTKVNTLRDTIKLVVDDIDKACWSLKLSVEAYKIHSQREMPI